VSDDQNSLRSSNPIGVNGIRDAIHPTLRTGRLYLRPLQAGDAEILHHIYQTEGVLQYFPNTIPPSLEKVQRFINGQQAQWQQHGYGNWGIVPDGTKEICGWAGLQYLPELDATEIGYLLDRPFWGKGYATEAALASLHFGFKHFSLDHIIALVHPENLASRRVIEKCGMYFQNRIIVWGTCLMRFRISRQEFHVDKN
jgi:RimJ/RimL family protein N-acetyltransferase